jgi:hypothetical protein
MSHAASAIQGAEQRWHIDDFDRSAYDGGFVAVAVPRGMRTEALSLIRRDGDEWRIQSFTLQMRQLFEYTGIAVRRAPVLLDYDLRMLLDKYAAERQPGFG